MTALPHDRPEPTRDLLWSPASVPASCGCARRSWAIPPPRRTWPRRPCSRRGGCRTASTDPTGAEPGSTPSPATSAAAGCAREGRRPCRPARARWQRGARPRHRARARGACRAARPRARPAAGGHPRGAGRPLRRGAQPRRDRRADRHVGRRGLDAGEPGTGAAALPARDPVRRRRGRRGLGAPRRRGLAADPAALSRLRAGERSSCGTTRPRSPSAATTATRTGCPRGCRSTRRSSPRSWATYAGRARSRRGSRHGPMPTGTRPAPSCVRCDRPVRARPYTRDDVERWSGRHGLLRRV